jgi:hypothetical protein
VAGPARENDVVHQKKRPIPAWLLGLLLAAVIFALALFLLDILGYGDDPVIEEGASALVTALH